MARGLNNRNPGTTPVRKAATRRGATLAHPRSNNSEDHGMGLPAIFVLLHTTAHATDWRTISRNDRRWAPPRKTKPKLYIRTSPPKAESPADRPLDTRDRRLNSHCGSPFRSSRTHGRRSTTSKKGWELFADSSIIFTFIVSEPTDTANKKDSLRNEHIQSA